ncbi:hypothetical protein B0H16DRAFT_1535379 [Mycena metata]|uniref:GATA-type domain-containing protein n=1 Tax=Mycena metata TaxID=1033252 RepID=A0AAD7J8U2_9AGAR|nr:hypothetical protein B0H16DRAFT_1535379 [Mycena metata]
MPHRVEPHSMSTTTQPQPAYSYAPPPAPPSKQRRSPYERPANNNRASSPPPITTLPGSPSPPDRSAVSTPPAQQQQQQQPPPPPHHYATYDMQRYPPGTYMYAPPPPQYAHPHPHDQRYDPQQQPQYAHAPQPYPGGYIPYPLPGTVLGAPTGAPGAPASAIPVVHTDDAATKLSDRVRRRCFNCCTTDTSTWRRSNLSPGKVLCNKCGLFERTHSRPRPEQFPHKRGPLAASTLRAREGEQGVSCLLPIVHPPLEITVR